MNSEHANTVAIENLVDEVVALFHLLQAVASRVHQDIGITAAKRGVLIGIAKSGAQTVPQMARARPVSRQYLQTIVNQLSDEGLVEMTANPAHKRSGLIQLTPAGKELVAGLAEKEKDLVGALQIEATEREMQTTLAVLTMLRERLSRFDSEFLQHNPLDEGVYPC